ncbi:hypothetical protein [Novosphingobium mangrovi (ex Huang et al. 2023)]|uniref:Uncharacterized protein n=1 Tax=Novosphingobium mangrovi (ex Huang et al. 2023) TaxID=2976432 RepID=A0ABT2I4F1_9SPHN|nr:hypothetical protein [Novosphingobium mangrovi (ex Huang et al. 2023)]MCT2399684.1 hypothetical protein [Novosphingobium mangrovi (ex Huang et al. 2023)]
METDAGTDTTACELHVWPADGLRSTYHGWFHGGIVDGAVEGREGYRKLPGIPLDTPHQVELLRASPLAEALALPGYRTLVHEQALDSNTARHTPGRLIADAPSCYAELVVDDVFFQEDIVNGKFLKILFRYRSFDGDALTRRFGTYTQVPLTAFPPATPDAVVAASSDIDQAYERSLTEFGTALQSPPKQKKKK